MISVNKIMMVKFNNLISLRVISKKIYLKYVKECLNLIFIVFRRT